MSRWEVELRYQRKLLESDQRYLEVISLAHPQVGYLRHREANGYLYVTVETEAENSEKAVMLALNQSRQLWVHERPTQAQVVESP